ncbi:MAG: extracellular solute-binding protein, partial [Clostridiales bacterium]|nr:extracellular solute-binding protein [Clostridiales bacterium]
MKKLLSLSLCAIMAFSLLTGCGGNTGAAPSEQAATGNTTAGSTEESTAPDEGSDANTEAAPTTIKVANWDTATMPYITEMVDAFMASHSDIKVEIVDIPSADYNTKLSVMLNGGSEVDAFWIKDGDTTKGLNDKGQLADMAAYIERDGVDLADYAGLAERFIFDGKTVALPARTDYYVLFYNKDIFDAANVPYPTNDMTWQEWEELCAQLTSGEGAEKIYGGHLHTWQACVQNWGVQDGAHTIMDTDYSFFKPAYEMAIRMQDAGTIMDYATLTSGSIHYSSPFLQGTVATLPMGTWFMATIIQSKDKGESDINWGIATLPHPDGVEAGWTVGSVTPFAINEASPNKDAAW